MGERTAFARAGSTTPNDDLQQRPDHVCEDESDKAEGDDPIRVEFVVTDFPGEFIGECIDPAINGEGGDHIDLSAGGGLLHGIAWGEAGRDDGRDRGGDDGWLLIMTVAGAVRTTLRQSVAAILALAIQPMRGSC
jgi:hypothetical protein